MSWLDLVILLIVGASAVMGLKIGVTCATLASPAMFVGGIHGVQLSGDFGGLFRGMAYLTFSSEVED